MPIDVIPTELSDVLEIVPRKFGDERGYFMELGRTEEFEQLGIPSFVQENQSKSTRGVLRGIHYQADPRPQGKLVRAVQGCIWDVAVDLRRSSTTFLEWVARELDAEASNMLWIPPGFGHGFIALTDPAVVHYRTTAVFDADLDRAVAYDDEQIGIEWPLAGEQTVSDKDRTASGVDTAELFA